MSIFSPVSFAMKMLINCSQATIFSNCPDTEFRSYISLMKAAGGSAFTKPIPELRKHHRQFIHKHSMSLTSLPPHSDIDEVLELSEIEMQLYETVEKNNVAILRRYEEDSQRESQSQTEAAAMPEREPKRLIVLRRLNVLRVLCHHPLAALYCK